MLEKLFRYKFKKQQYQQEAVKSIIDVFEGQQLHTNLVYQRDLGKIETSFFDNDSSFYNGYKNNNIEISKQQILNNIRTIQSKTGLKISEKLIYAFKEDNDQTIALDVQMETGTGKTYVYINTIFELNKKYGWSKFIIIVPSIAIREGVMKSFNDLQSHFYADYNKKANVFIYNSDRKEDIDNFSSSNNIEVMIINSQAFNSTDNRNIHKETEKLGYRKPIDIIKKNNPIIILDEPQKLEGKKTTVELKKFNPLFCLYFSATLTTRHNLVYALDTIQAYKECLNKKIYIDTIQQINSNGLSSYLMLEKINVSKDAQPSCTIQYEYKLKSGEITKKTSKFNVKDSIFDASNGMKQYEGFIISSIDANINKIEFINGKELYVNQAIENDETDITIRKQQISSAIKRHLDKEQELFKKDIKCLTLFFLDKVINYRNYDNKNNYGIYAQFFNEEYKKLVNEKIKSKDISEEYKKYLQSIKPENTHNGYFSIDKKGHAIDTLNDKDIDAYDLILKNKEKLLSFNEPTRFIFSHSALREGWDNPNIFQICFLKKSGVSEIAKRQEIGRGLRICVDANGERYDLAKCGDDDNVFWTINSLIINATADFNEFAKCLQKDMQSNTIDRIEKFTKEIFKGRPIINQDTGEHDFLNNSLIDQISTYMESNEYVDSNKNITPKYYDDKRNDELAEMPDSLRPFSDSIHGLIQRITTNEDLNNSIENINEQYVRRNKLNKQISSNIYWIKLWNSINCKYGYKVNFDSNVLINNSIKAINENLLINSISYQNIVAEQNVTNTTKENLIKGEVFSNKKVNIETINVNFETSKAWDLITKIVNNTKLTRKTIIQILAKINVEKFNFFKVNPESFITKVSNIINNQKGLTLIPYITYYKTSQKQIEDYQPFLLSIEAGQTSGLNKCLTLYKPQLDSNVERNFLKSLEENEKVKIYTKLPKSFKIPTPIGNYSPDWVSVIQLNSLDKITSEIIFYSILETKEKIEGLSNEYHVTETEKSKNEYAKALFNLDQNEIFKELLEKNHYLKYNVCSNLEDLTTKIKNYFSTILNDEK